MHLGNVRPASEQRQNGSKSEVQFERQHSRPAEVLWRPRYAASGEPGEPGTDPMDDANDTSGGEDRDAGIV